MRHWLVILMILFTPLRGLAADVMAISMAQQQGSAAHHAPASLPTHATAAPAPHPDCAQLAELPPAPGDSSAHVSSAADDTCPTCASCMVCSSVALALQNRLPTATPLHHAVPSPRMAFFSSASPLPGFKPPIS